jgi:K+-transporting ATPase ATPase C chain
MIINQAIRLFVILTFITGLVYPLVVTVVGNVAFPDQANGELVKIDGKIVGSRLIGQKFAGDKYFWPRPSAVDYNPLPSGGSNQGMTSALLDSAVHERMRILRETRSDSAEIPSDLLFASGSGLDPHISPEAATYQIDRIAMTRGLDNAQKALLTNLVQTHIEPPQLGIFGQPRVNVLELNLSLDSAFVSITP